MIDIGLIIGYILFGVAAIGAIAFPIMYMIKHPKESKLTFLGIAAILIIFLLAWLISSSEVTEKYNLLGVNGSESKLIGAMLISAYVIALLTLVMAIASAVKNVLVNR